MRSDLSDRNLSPFWTTSSAQIWKVLNATVLISLRTFRFRHNKWILFPLVSTFKLTNHIYKDRFSAIFSINSCSSIFYIPLSPTKPNLPSEFRWGVCYAMMHMLYWNTFTKLKFWLRTLLNSFGFINCLKFYPHIWIYWSVS